MGNFYCVQATPECGCGQSGGVPCLPENLYREFEAGESLANKKWVGKVIEITGTVSSVSDAGNYISINLRATDDAGINCSVLKKDLAAEDRPQTGTRVTIKGKCTGFLIDVNLVDCIIKK